MENLKDFNEIIEPDERQKHFIFFDPVLNKDRSFELKDFHSDALSVKLHDGVPEEIRSHFATAQNLIVYSWFYYPFNVTAGFMAFISLEFALKERFKPKKQVSFKWLIKKAVQEEVIKAEGFSKFQRLIDNRKHFDNKMDEDELAEQMKNYTEILIKVIPFFRNEFAHGVDAVDNHGVSWVRTCSEFINQLYPNEAGKE